MSFSYYDFYDRFNQWIDDDDPPEDFRFWVMAWLNRLQDDPYADAAPAEQLGEEWWFVKIPHAEDEETAVVCLYSVIGSDVRCTSITTLRKPIL